MKVNVLSFKEKPFRSEGMHKVEIELGEYFSDPTLNLMAISSVNAGYKHYKLPLNLFQYYKDNPEVMTNGSYDVQKALSLCKKEFPVGSTINWDGELYEFSIAELSSGQYEAIESTQNHYSYISSFYRASIKHDRESAKRECVKHLLYLIDSGYYIPSKK